MYYTAFIIDFRIGKTLFISCQLTYLIYTQVPGTRWDYRTLQELQQHVHSAIPEQVSVLLLVLIVVLSCKGFLALWQPLVKERIMMICCVRVPTVVICRTLTGLSACKNNVSGHAVSKDKVSWIDRRFRAIHVDIFMMGRRIGQIIQVCIGCVVVSLKCPVSSVILTRS